MEGSAGGLHDQTDENPMRGTPGRVVNASGD
jgi:hypothetical protein